MSLKQSDSPLCLFLQSGVDGRTKRRVRSGGPVLPTSCSWTADADHFGKVGVGGRRKFETTSDQPVEENILHWVGGPKITKIGVEFGDAHGGSPVMYVRPVPTMVKVDNHITRVI